MDQAIYKKIKEEYLSTFYKIDCPKKERSQKMLDFIQKYQEHSKELTQLSIFLDREYCLGCFLIHTVYSPTRACDFYDCQRCIQEGGSINFIMNKINKPLSYYN